MYQQVEGVRSFDAEYERSEIEDILRQRAETTQATMKTLSEKGVCLMLYIEIDAERGQRSLTLETDFGRTARRSIFRSIC